MKVGSVWARETARVAGLVAFVVVVFGVVYGRTSLQAWRLPIAYSGDALSFLAQLKASQDGAIRPISPTFVPDLNAPYEANWNDYPLPNKTFYWVAGRVASRIGLFPAANLLLLLAHVLAALAFYAVARYLRLRPAWALAGAVAFGLSHYLWYRSLVHLALSLCWHLPLDILVVAWCFRPRGLDVRSRRFLAAALVAVLAALFNVYYAAMFVQFLGLGALVQIARGRWRRAAAPALLAALVVGVFALESLGTLLYPLRHGRNEDAVHRSYGDLENYALKPIELVLPLPGHGLLSFGRIAPEYWANARGEVGSAYLGLAGIAGALLLVGPVVTALVRRRRIRLPQTLGAVAWVLAFSVAGGINGVLGGFGVVLLRGTNRYSAWILALCLLFLVGRLSRRRWRLPAPALAGAFTFVVLADQLPPPVYRGIIGEMAADVEADRAFAARVEQALLGRPMVFMLPVMAYPEVQGVRQISDYEHFRPFLYTSRVRYSYGTHKGRAREEWQWSVAGMPTAKMLDRLESYGFSGLIVDRRGYVDDAGALLAEIASLGRPILVDDPVGQRVFVRLRPTSTPRLPASVPGFGEGWRGRPIGGLTWARGTEAALLVDNETERPRAFALSFQLTVARPRTVALRQDGHELGSWRVADSVSVSEVPLLLPPGQSHLILTTDRPPDVAELGNRLRLGTFAVAELELRPMGDAR